MVSVSVQLVGGREIDVSQLSSALLRLCVGRYDASPAQHSPASPPKNRPLKRSTLNLPQLPTDWKRGGGV